MSKDPASRDVESTQSKAPFRPNLSQSISPGNDDERILSTLGAPRKPGKNLGETRKVPTTFATIMLAAAVVAGAGYWYFMTQSGSQRKGQEIAKVDTSVASAKVDEAVSNKPSATQPVPPPLPAVQSVSPAEQAAQIVNDPKSTNPPNANAETKLTDALENGVKPPDAALQKALESKPKPAERTIAAKADAKPKAAPKAAVTQTAKANTTSNQANAKSNAKSNAESSSKVAASNATASAASSKNTAAAGDKDINLIAALLAHNAATQTNTKPQGAVKVNTGATPTTTAAPASAPSATMKPGSTSTQAKSVVAARSDTTGSAMKQCEGLDFLERELCRFKACDGLWESDSSCKATLSSAK